MLTEQTGYKVDVMPDGRMKVHEMTYFFEDGIEVSQSHGAYAELTGTDIPAQIAEAFLALPDQAAAAVEAAAKAALEAEKAQAIIDSLPSWQAVSDAIDAAFTNVGQRKIIKKMARVLYWLAKGTEE